MTRVNSTLWPSFIAFASAGLWGLYWLPLRSIESAGVSGLWATCFIYAIPMLFLVPLAIARRSRIREHIGTLLLIGLAIGGGLACYAIGFLYTTIMRTTLLFYLTPVWSTLLGMLLLGEKVNWRRWVAIAVGFAGLLLLLASGTESLDLTQINSGDIAALFAGLLWGAGTVLIKRSPEVDTPDMLPVQYLCAALVTLVLILITGQTASAPTVSQAVDALPVIIVFYVLIILPSMYACIWAARLLSPGRMGILMMSEVLVAGISAPLLAGEVLSAREWAPALLILMAGLLEITSPANHDSLPD